MDVSISEVKQYLRCRRQWDFESHNRRNLVSRRAMPHVAFHIGTVAHKILEENIFLGATPDIDKIIKDAETELEDEYRSVVGAGWSTVERESVEEGGDIVRSMMTAYFRYYTPLQPLGPDMQYECAEVTFRVPIPSTEHHLRGTIDGIAKQPETGQYWLVEHKTVGTYFPKIEDLQVNYQMLAYSWAFWQLTGTIPAGVIYDGMLKKQYKRKVPTPDELFMRHRVRFSKAALQQFENELCSVSNEMSDTEQNILPNFLWQGCYDCSVRDLCTATQLREDVGFLIAEKYKPNPGWRTTKVEPISTFKLS